MLSLPDAEDMGEYKLHVSTFATTRVALLCDMCISIVNKKRCRFFPGCRLPPNPKRRCTAAADSGSYTWGE